MRKVFVRSLWTLLAIVILGSAVAFTAIWNGFIGYMPPVEDLQNPINRFATQIYSADGKVIGTWNFNRENRVCVSYNDISPYLVQALVATEDVRFYDHSGVDFIALGRAIVKRGLFGQASAGGGSTITQQLAKQLYSETAKSTMQRALQELEARGLLNTQRTAGRTVTEDETMIAQLREQLAAEQIGAFLQMMEKLGYTRAQTLALLQQKAQEE